MGCACRNLDRCRNLTELQDRADARHQRRMNNDLGFLVGLESLLGNRQAVTTSSEGCGGKCAVCVGRRGSRFPCCIIRDRNRRIRDRRATGICNDSADCSGRRELSQ